MFYRNSRNKKVLWTLKNYFNQLATSLLWITLFVILICVNPIVRNITNCHVVSEKIIWLIQMPMFREKFTEKNISTTLKIIRILIAFIINLFMVRSHKNPSKWLLIIWQRIENLHTKYYNIEKNFLIFQWERTEQSANSQSHLLNLDSKETVGALETWNIFNMETETKIFE